MTVAEHDRLMSEQADKYEEQLNVLKDKLDELKDELEDYRQAMAGVAFLLRKLKEAPPFQR